jgi:RhtB (resistance to homoserine/threonine) family protein
MGSPEQFLIFLAAAVLLNVSPGADHVFILTRTIAQGRLAGFLSSWGVCTGAMIHVLAAAFGISAILAASATAFTVVKLAGAAYLIWLGIRALQSKGLALSTDTAATPPATAWKIYRQGMVVDLLNPKVAVFFMAFLPQFVDPALGAAAWQMIALGAVVIAVALIWETFLIFGAGALSRRLRTQPSIAKWINRVSGATFIGLGVKLAVERR